MFPHGTCFTCFSCFSPVPSTCSKVPPLLGEFGGFLRTERSWQGGFLRAIAGRWPLDSAGAQACSLKETL